METGDGSGAGEGGVKGGGLKHRIWLLGGFMNMMEHVMSNGGDGCFALHLAAGVVELERRLLRAGIWLSLWCFFEGVDVVLERAFAESFYISA